MCSSTHTREPNREPILRAPSDAHFSPDPDSSFCTPSGHVTSSSAYQVAISSAPCDADSSADLDACSSAPSDHVASFGAVANLLRAFHDPRHE